MKNSGRRPQLTELCQSARHILDGHALDLKPETDSPPPALRKLNELFGEIKRQLEGLGGSTPTTLTKR